MLYRHLPSAACRSAKGDCGHPLDTACRHKQIRSHSNGSTPTTYGNTVTFRCDIDLGTLPAWAAAPCTEIASIWNAARALDLSYRAANISSTWVPVPSKTLGLQPTNQRLDSMSVCSVAVPACKHRGAIHFTVLRHGHGSHFNDAFIVAC